VNNTSFENYSLHTFKSWSIMTPKGAIKPEQENDSRPARSVILHSECCVRLPISGFALAGDPTSKRASKDWDPYHTKIPASCQVALKQSGTKDANCCTRALCAQT